MSDGTTPAAAPLRGRRIGVDVGAVRVGVASCDPDGILATPVETVRRGPGDAGTAAAVRRLAAIVAEYEAVEVVVGLPRTLRGEEGAAAVAAQAFGDRLAAAVDVPLVYTDERLTTVTATAALHAAGRKTRRHREVIDQAAAVAILQGWLERRRSSRETEDVT